MGHVSLVNIDDDISGAHDRVSSRASSLIERGELVASGLKCNAMRVRAMGTKTSWGLVRLPN